MRTIILILALVLTTTAYSQTPDTSTYNAEMLERLKIEEILRLRKEINFHRQEIRYLKERLSELLEN